jgi:Raf kinase inhibitor-like YbhB/YbcL family protein
VHWVLFNLPGNEVQLPEDVHRGEVLPQKFGGALQGKNDFRRIGYGGPCPPPGTLHRYFFKLYALDATVPLKAGATKKDLEEAMQGHILATAELMGTYTRQRLSSAAH